MYDAPKKTEENKARNNRIKRHDADWKKIDEEEKVVSNYRHDTDYRGKKKTAKLAPAAITKENGLFVKAESGEN